MNNEVNDVLARVADDINKPMTLAERAARKRGAYHFKAGDEPHAVIAEEVEHAVPENTPENEIIPLKIDKPSEFEEQRARVHDGYLKSLDAVQASVDAAFDELFKTIEETAQIMKDSTEVMKEQVIKHLNAAEEAHNMSGHVNDVISKIKGGL